jgi:hypothetical protein
VGGRGHWRRGWWWRRRRASIVGRCGALRCRCAQRRGRLFARHCCSILYFIGLRQLLWRTSLPTLTMVQSSCPAQLTPAQLHPPAARRCLAAGALHRAQQRAACAAARISGCR